MYCDVGQWRHIRRRILEKGTPKKQIARETGVSRRTINKMLTHEHPPGYGPRPLRYPKLEPYIQTIDRLLHDTISFPPGAREVAHSTMPPIRLNRERKRLRDIEWMRQMLQKEMNEGPLHRELGDIPDLAVLLQHLHNGRLRDRNRAMVVLATHRKIPSKTICAFLGVAKAFVLKYRNKFKTSGTAAIFAPQTKSNRKIDDFRFAECRLWPASRTTNQPWDQPDVLDNAAPVSSS